MSRKSVEDLRREMNIRDARPEDDDDPELNPDEGGDDGVVVEEDGEDGG